MLMPNSMPCSSWTPNGLTKPIKSQHTAMVAQEARASVTLDRSLGTKMTAMIVLKGIQAAIDMDLHRVTAVIATQDHLAMAVTAIEDRPTTKIQPHQSNATRLNPASVAHLSLVTTTSTGLHHPAMVNIRGAVLRHQAMLNWKEAVHRHQAMVNRKEAVLHHQAMAKHKEATDKILGAKILTDMVKNPATVTKAGASPSKSA